MFSKIDVNGKNAHPLYKALKEKYNGNKEIDWNFAKFLVNTSNGEGKFYGAPVEPQDMLNDIKGMFWGHLLNEIKKEWIWLT